MLRRIILLLIVVLLAELALLLVLADLTSWQITLGLILASGLIGVVILRFSGVIYWRRSYLQLASGKLPAESLLDGLLVMLAGVLLIIPGVLTDAAALALLFPPSRKPARRWLTRWMLRRLGFGPPTGRSRIIDTRVIDESDES